VLRDKELARCRSDQEPALERSQTMKFQGPTPPVLLGDAFAAEGWKIISDSSILR
jgi:hypothetical protein